MSLIKYEKKSDKHKTTFLTQYELFEYVIMFFELCNASKISQIFINFTLKKYLDDFCIDYLNNILIYNNNKKNYIVHVFKILKRLQHVELFLNINKYDFFVTSIKYLKLIIIIEKITINSAKIKVIVNWKLLKNVKNVQTFLDFANFYKKFILKYFKIITFFYQINEINQKKLRVFLKFWKFWKKDFSKLETCIYNNIYINAFRFKNKNINKNKRIELCNNNNNISTKLERKFILNNVYVKKNVIDEMQLRNIR